MPNTFAMISPSKKMLLSAAIAAIVMSAICCFATLNIYAGNVGEFSVSYIELLRVYLPYMLIAIIVAGLFGVFMTNNGLNRYLAILSALAVLLWLQGSILVWDYGVLDGRQIAWMSGVWRGILDAAVWIAVLLLAIYAHARVSKPLIITAVATFAMQLVGAAVTVADHSADLLSSLDSESNRVGRDAVLRFSRGENIVHVVMDGFQSDIFAEILEGQGNDGLKNELQGFTFFRNNLGAYPYTQLTVPALLSGKLHRNEVPVKEFVSHTMQGHTILSAAHDSGYEIDIAAPASLAGVYRTGKHTYSYGISSSEHVSQQDYIDNDAAKLIDLAIFRVVPHFAKALVYRDELWIFQAGLRSEAYLQLQYFSDLAFLRQLAAGMTVDRDAPVYKMIHVMLSHRPTVGNEQCEYDGRRRTTRVNVTTQAGCGLTHVVAVLQRMKALGIYDSSTIVLMADHGAWVPVERQRASEDGDAVVNAMVVAMAVPMLAVKPPGSYEPLQISNAPTSVLDVPATIAQLSGINAQFEGNSVFAIDAGADRERRHLIYGYGNNPDADGYLFPMQEYVIKGSPFDANTWRRGDRYLPEGIVSAAHE